MAKSMLAAIHDAQHLDPALNSPQGGETGATAPKTEEDTTMSTDTPAPRVGATVTKVDHDAAVSSAETSGREAGAAAERTRLSNALSADGIKGDGKRMSAALDLAVKSPAMSAEDVTAFVTGNMPAASADQPSAYEQQRVVGSGLAAPSAPPAATSSWASTAQKINERRA